VEWEFDGEVFEWRGPAPFYFVETPEDADAYLHDNLAELSFGWGCMRAQVRVGTTRISTVLIPKDDVYVVPMKVALRRAEKFDDGDVVRVHLSVGD
jgi:hypothetical protein